MAQSAVSFVLLAAGATSTNLQSENPQSENLQSENLQNDESTSAEWRQLTL